MSEGYTSADKIRTVYYFRVYMKCFFLIYSALKDFSIMSKSQFYFCPSMHQTQNIDDNVHVSMEYIYFIRTGLE